MNVERTARSGHARRHAAELEIKYPGVLTIRSTYTWLRLSVGPPLLFGLLIFTHVGLRPQNLTLPYCLGNMVVLFGTLLLVGVQSTPVAVRYLLTPDPISSSVRRFGVAPTTFHPTLT